MRSHMLFVLHSLTKRIADWWITYFKYGFDLNWKNVPMIVIKFFFRWKIELDTTITMHVKRTIFSRFSIKCVKLSP